VIQATWSGHEFDPEQTVNSECKFIYNKEQIILLEKLRFINMFIFIYSLFLMMKRWLKNCM
jgi:hypothetical protein